MIGKISVHLYPDIHPLMPVAEKAHGYHVTTTSLKGARLAPDVYVDHLGMHLDSTSLVAGLKQDFMDRFDEHWLDWNNLTILSFHNTQGQAFGNNAVTPADLSVLKPVVNGAVANCRPADVRFVRVECTLDFRTLCTAAEPTDNTTLRCSYYIELPQSTVVVNDGNNNPRNLRTWQGVADLRTLSVEEMGTHIISQTPQDCPVMLQEHDAYVTNARIDDSSAMEEITRAILKLFIPTIEKSIFKTLCPNYTNKPHAAVEGLQQTSYDDEGNVNVLPIANFYSVLMRAIQPFAHMKTFPVNVCDIFYRGLHEDIKTVFEELYPNYIDPVPFDGRTQRNTLPTLLSYATMAENRVLAQQRMYTRMHGTTFVSGGTYASQAERTIAQYNSPPGTPAKPSHYGPSTPPRTPTPGGKTPKQLSPNQRCFGCGASDHPFSLCPDKDVPAAKERAKKKFDALREELRSGKKRRLRNGTPNLSDFDGETQKKLTQQALEATAVTDGDTNASVASSLTQPSLNSPRPPAGRGRGTNRKPTIYITDAVAMAIGNKQPLPVPINSFLLHTPIQLSTEGRPDSPSLMAVVDTAASMCLGNSAFLFAIAKAFPSTIAAVYTAEDYAPITLSGVVRRDDNVVTTSLPVAFLFNLDYFTKEGQPAQLMVAAGPDVSVNLILGNTFIQATNMVIDYGDNVIECRAFDCPPFPAEFRAAQLNVPALDTAQLATDGTFSALVSDLAKLEADISSAFGSSLEHKPKKVKFTANYGLSSDLARYSSTGALDGQSPRDLLTDGLEVDQGSHSVDDCFDE